jgi:hypothetical protein
MALINQRKPVSLFLINGVTTVSDPSVIVILALETQLY